MSERPPRELLPKAVRIALGVTGPGVDQDKLREAVAGKVVLITGASSGVGKATARRLGSAGAEVLLVARRAELLEAIAQEIGPNAHVHPCDLADPAQVKALADDVLAQHGRVDILVSNAGLSIKRWISDSYERFHDIERTNAVNFLGPAQLVLALLPSMRERGSGHIINIATAAVAQPSVEWSAYVASKGAFETWLRAVAPEARADGVFTTSLLLSIVRTPMLGPSRSWRYVPGMTPREAAAMIARAIVERPRTVAPWWVRTSAPLNAVTQVPAEWLQTRYAQFANPASRPGGATGRAIGAVGAAGRIADDTMGALLTIASSRAVAPVRPDRAARALAGLHRYGQTPAGVAAAAAALHPGRWAVHDEQGTLTFAELDERARALAAALHEHVGLRSGARVALMCRNHRGFVEAAVGAARLGCDLILLNTDYAAPQLLDVLARERIDAVLHDEEFRELLEEFPGQRIVAGEALPQATREAPRPRNPGSVVLMTSGTTGTPKGVSRGLDASRLAATAVGGFLTLAHIKPTPRSGAAILCAPPLFHLYGYAVMMGAFAFGSPIVIRRRFDAAATLADIERHRVEVLCVVPTMLKRIMSLPSAERGAHDTSSLRMVPCGAAPLAPELARAFMDEFGDLLYNAYASTELGAGTLATPADLRAAPGTVGRAPIGVIVRILDDEGVALAPGATGRIFVGTAFQFESYSDGTTKDVIDGLMRSGDVGHLDRAGRLFIDGRDDDMILSGGENVYPQEVEDVLLAHDAIADAAVLGVADEDFGQRLAAVVVLRGDVSADELRAYVGSRLARFKVPRDVTFVESLPRTTTGKLKRGALADLLA